MSFYTEHQRELQDRFETRPLADGMEMGIVTEQLDEGQIAFIESRDFFFLSTVNGNGEPTVSYKGGGVGVVRVLDDTTVAFPAYDGNGMFLSLGNIDDTAKIGMLFIDFETPQRVRVQATATLHLDDELLGEFPGAIAIVRATVDHAFVNCARYIHEHTRNGTSKYVPDENGEQPYPMWKRIDLLQPLLGEADRQRTVDAGGTVTGDEYGAALMAGDS
jgi:predicted pyridoxine 5'-phosphate oxidase superfamily flavin-nucleotide-binding protein